VVILLPLQIEWTFAPRPTQSGQQDGCRHAPLRSPYRQKAPVQYHHTRENAMLPQVDSGQIAFPHHFSAAWRRGVSLQVSSAKPHRLADLRVFGLVHSGIGMSVLKHVIHDLADLSSVAREPNYARAD